MTTIMKTIHKIAAVVIKNNEFLMVRKVGKDVWTILGGKPDELSAYLVELIGNPKISDPELEEFKYIGKDYKDKGIRLPESIEKQIIPYCIKQKLFAW